jgi:hypothetical protein
MHDNASSRQLFLKQKKKKRKKERKLEGRRGARKQTASGALTNNPRGLRGVENQIVSSNRPQPHRLTKEDGENDQGPQKNIPVAHCLSAT